MLTHGSVSLWTHTHVCNHAWLQFHYQSTISSPLFSRSFRNILRAVCGLRIHLSFLKCRRTIGIYGFLNARRQCLSFWLHGWKQGCGCQKWRLEKNLNQLQQQLLSMGKRCFCFWTYSLERKFSYLHIDKILNWFELFSRHYKQSSARDRWLTQFMTTRQSGVEQLLLDCLNQTEV